MRNELEEYVVRCFEKTFGERLPNDSEFAVCSIYHPDENSKGDKLSKAKLPTAEIIEGEIYTNVKSEALPEHYMYQIKTLVRQVFNDELSEINFMKIKPEIDEYIFRSGMYELTFNEVKNLNL